MGLLQKKLIVFLERNIDFDSGSMVLETDGSKATLEDEDSEFLGVEERIATPTGFGKSFDEGDAKSEVLEADIYKKCNSSGKRVRCEINGEGSPTLDWKKKKNLVTSPDNELVSVVADSEGGNIHNDDGIVLLDHRLSTKEIENCSRKCESSVKMLDWLIEVAKDPCGPTTSSLPEKSKWNSYGIDQLWKQVLLARECRILKRQDDTLIEQNWQKFQRMHPQMYDDQFGTNYHFRDRLKNINKSGKSLAAYGQACSESLSSGPLSNMPKPSNPSLVGIEDRTSDSSTADSIFCIRAPKQKVPVGSHFQAMVSLWRDMPSESDSKWLGTKIWPLKGTERRSLIERDPIGRGRQDSCGCEIAGSTECFRFHIAEKRIKAKIELGSSFYTMKFDEMGEDVELYWSSEEQKRFAAVVKSNPQSEDKCFWDQIFKNFPNRSRDSLVSYYFNVFLLQRRAYQNRFTKDNVDSDDDETETTFVAKSSTSIFYSPSKPNAKSK